MQRFLATYVQDVTQSLNASSIESAGKMAREYAANHKHLKLLSVEPFYPVAPPAPTPPPLPGDAAA